MSNRAEIIPAILPKDFYELENDIMLVKDFVKTVQIDICDGQFTPSPTWPYRKEDDTWKKMLREEAGFPGWEKLNFEIDLMANKPEEKVEDWVLAGANRIIIHARSKGDVMKAVDMLAGRVEVGIALNIDEPLTTIEQYLPKIQFVQLMGIDHIGYQGQDFDEKVLGRVKEFHLLHPGMPVSVDGGVSLKTAPKLIAARADRLVVGSAIFHSDNPIDAVHTFKALRI